MKALVWCAPYKVKTENVPEPKIINKRDAIVRITSTCICGSDLHLLDGFVPFMKPGDIMGHEPMGIVEEVGSEVDQNKVKKGDRVVVPFPIACGNCFFCRRELYSCCDNTNPKSYIGENVIGQATAGIFGYSHLTGGYAGGQAEFLRVPFADVNCQKMPQDLTDHQLVFLSDIFPTGYMAVEHCNPQPDDTVAIWGCGPVGQFTIRSAFLLKAGKVVAIDSEKKVPERMRMARDAGAITIDMDTESVYERLLDLTGASARTSASTPSEWRRTASPRSTTPTTRSRRTSSWRPSARTSFARPSTAAARAARSRSPACMAACPTRFPWAR